MGNASTTHFVYQSAENDATIVAHVQNLETIDQTGSAGLMIRQCTRSEVARVEGPSASAPVWLKLERKEGSIYAYRSVDGVTWQLVTTAVLALSKPPSLGIFTTTLDTTVGATISEVALHQSDDEPPIAEETKTFDGVTPNAIQFSNGSAVAVGTGSIKSPTQITLKTFENRPEGGAPVRQLSVSAR